MTFAKFIFPSKTLILNVGAIRFVADILSGNAGAVGLAEGVTAGNERNGFLVIHRHARESLSDIPRRGDGIGLSIRSFRIHVDQTQPPRGERVPPVPIRAGTPLGKPPSPRAPVHLLRFPHVLASAAKTE